jgi:uncharacterized protein YdaU (DUF1376 family)
LGGDQSVSENPDVQMPFFIGDFLKHVARCDHAEGFAYVLLICDYWINGILPDDDQTLANVAKVSLRDWRRKFRPRLSMFFVIDGGFWRQKRVEHELEKARTRMAKSREANAARWANDPTKPDKDKLGRSRKTATPRRSSGGVPEEPLRSPLRSSLDAPNHNQCPTDKPIEGLSDRTGGASTSPAERRSRAALTAEERRQARGKLLDLAERLGSARKRR